MADIEIRQLRPDDEDGARKLICKDFIQLEPINQALKLSEDDGEIWFDITFPGILREGVSTVAVNTDTGDIVGVSFVAGIRKDEPEASYISKDDPNTRNLALVYEVLTSGYKGVDLFAKYNVDKFANFHVLCVKRCYQRQGIGSKLVAKSMELVRAKNILLLTTEATGHFSSRVFQKLGFEKTSRCDYDSMVIDGKPLPMTKELEYHKGVTFYVKLI